MQVFPDVLTIKPKPPLDAVLTVPGSKSLTNRALVVAALADGVQGMFGRIRRAPSREFPF